MHLYIHGGCHKTATSAFQAFCSENAKALLEHGVAYPLPDEGRQHSYIMHDMQRGETDSLERALKAGLGQGVDAILLSGEDFENCLVDLDLAKRVEAIAFQLGITEITWLFIHRDMESYVRSLYAELSKHQIVVRLSTLQARARAAGYFTASTETYSHVFVLDMDRHVPRFAEAVKGQVETFTFDHFVEGAPGRILLERMAGAGRLLDGSHPRSDNRRISPFWVEKNYAQSFFGLRLRDTSPLRLVFAWLIVPPAALIRMLFQPR